MKTCKSLNFCSETPTVCALGCFDGVHIGHSSIIKETKRIANLLSIPAAVWSFAEPPKNYFSPESVTLITSAAEKRAIMQKLGVDIFVSVHFNKNISDISATDFFKKFLLEKMKAKHIVCGFNYHFGKGGEGDTALLRRLCADNGIGISVMPPVELDGTTVSSTEIRKAIISGDIKKANRYLGRPFSLRAKVIEGQKLGRALGFPTINQSFPSDKPMLKNGVYISQVSVGNKKLYGITNVGIRPTVDGKTPYAETHIFDFNNDLYGRIVSIEFLDFMRDERKFNSVEQLSEQVFKDIEAAKSLIDSKKYTR